MRDRHTRHRIIRKNHREGLDIIRSCIDDLLQKADERGSDKLIKFFPRFFLKPKNKIKMN